MEENPIFLLKFQSEKSYQDNLVNNGQIFCGCAKIYSDLYFQNPKQGDIFECKMGKFSSKINLYNPIFCTYAIYKNDIINSKFIKLDIKTLKEFSDNNKVYITIIKFKDLVKHINLFSSISKINIFHGRVGYGKPTKKQEKYLYNNPVNFMFIKRSKYNNQNEYRFVFDDKCKQIIKEMDHDGFKNVLHYIKTLPQSYNISSIKEFCQCVEIDLSNCDTDILIKLDFKIMDKINKEKILDAFNYAFNMLLKYDAFAISNDSHEQCLSGRLAMYLREFLLNYENDDVRIDVEYNKDKQNTKLQNQNIPHDSNTNPYIRPDVLIHQRGTNDNNILYCEIKKNNDCDNNKVKEQVFHNRNYNFGVSISHLSLKLIQLELYEIVKGSQHCEKYNYNFIKNELEKTEQTNE